ncbi:universal stress protein [Rhodococcus sp. X156]|uniref:universal stress protein n=1 Tax=Rhodococcus sp. X156 TaxID=2499145 RepID=UPI001F49B5FD|nr:universal stress protein [Rhodococcus sp. X156]
MTGSGTIVVGVDGSAGSAHALRWAVRHAGLTGAQVRAVAAWEHPAAYGWAPVYPPNDPVPALTAAMLDRTVRATLGEHDAARVQQTATEGHAAQVLVDAADGAELLVVGTRGHRGLAAALLGSVSQQCVQHAPCPVVVVPEPRLHR